MPRHSQNAPGRRRNSSRPPGGAGPGKKAAARKAAAPRATKPFKKTSRPEADAPGKNFSQKSRFAKRRPGAPDGKGRGESYGKPRSGATDGKGRGESYGKPRSGAMDGKGRGESYGKPFKRTQRAKPVKSHPSPPHRRHLKETPTTGKSENVRLNKFIANSGISSRREADELIKMGLISVNGKIVSELGYKVLPGDEVRYEDKVLRAEKPVYILLNKPKGFITTTEDPQDRKTVMHIIGSIVKERIYPVGRLDRNTTGLLVLTNDGDLADKLMHPSFNVKKVYKVELDKPFSKNDFQKIIDGVHLEEGKVTVDDLAIVSEDARTVGVELHIGWNRVVRRIFESLGYEVTRLDRTAYAGLDKKDLARGQWRFLTKQEIIQLKHFK